MLDLDFVTGSRSSEAVSGSGFAVDGSGSTFVVGVSIFGIAAPESVKISSPVWTFVSISGFGVPGSVEVSSPVWSSSSISGFGEPGSVEVNSLVLSSVSVSEFGASSSVALNFSLWSSVSISRFGVPESVKVSSPMWSSVSLDSVCSIWQVLVKWQLQVGFPLRSQIVTLDWNWRRLFNFVEFYQTIFICVGKNTCILPIIRKECIRNWDLRVQVHPGEFWVSK